LRFYRFVFVCTRYQERENKETVNNSKNNATKTSAENKLPEQSLQQAHAAPQQQTHQQFVKPQNVSTSIATPPSSSGNSSLFM
jgi:hypothetical protein